MIKLSPSILSADFANLARDIAAAEAAGAVPQLRRVEVVAVGVRHKHVAHGVHTVSVALEGLEHVGAEVDLEDVAEVVGRAAADFAAAPCGGLAADAAVAEEGGNALGGGGSENQKSGSVHGDGVVA